MTIARVIELAVAAPAPGDDEGNGNTLIRDKRIAAPLKPA